MTMPDGLATLLLIVRAEIRSLELEAADLPDADAAPLLEQVERLSSCSRRFAKSSAALLRSH